MMEKKYYSTNVDPKKARTHFDNFFPYKIASFESLPTENVDN